jgi:hypothetical protein
VHRLHAWPAAVEALSGSLDFNRAPFFQSFIEVGVERSHRQVRLRLHGVHSPLRWRDLQTWGGVMPPGQGPDKPVELIVRYPEEHPALRGRGARITTRFFEGRAQAVLDRFEHMGAVPLSRESPF